MFTDTVNECIPASVRQRSLLSKLTKEDYSKVDLTAAEAAGLISQLQAQMAYKTFVKKREVKCNIK